MKRHETSNRLRVSGLLARDPLGVGYAVSLRTRDGARRWTLTNCATLTLLPYTYRTEAEARHAVATGQFAPRGRYRKPSVRSDAFGQRSLFPCLEVSL